MLTATANMEANYCHNSLTIIRELQATNLQVYHSKPNDGNLHSPHSLAIWVSFSQIEEQVRSIE